MNELGSIKICDAIRSYIASAYPDLVVERAYLETFDWDAEGIRVVVSPGDSVVSPKSHGENERVVTLAVFLFKNLEKLGAAESTDELDELVGILDRLSVLFCEQIEMTAGGKNVVIESSTLSSDGLYNVDALEQGKFIGGLQLTAREYFQR